MLMGREVIAGFITGGCLAIRGGRRAALNSAIACGCLLAVIEGVGIGFQRMMADNTKLEVSFAPSMPVILLIQDQVPPPPPPPNQTVEAPRGGAMIA